MGQSVSAMECRAPLHNHILVIPGLDEPSQVFVLLAPRRAESMESQIVVCDNLGCVCVCVCVCVLTLSDSSVLKLLNVSQDSDFVSQHGFWFWTASGILAQCYPMEQASLENQKQIISYWRRMSIWGELLPIWSPSSFNTPPSIGHLLLPLSHGIS